MKKLYLFFLLFATVTGLKSQGQIRELLPHEKLSMKIKGENPVPQGQKSAANWRLIADKYEYFNSVWENRDSSHYGYLQASLMNKVNLYLWNGLSWDSTYYADFFYDSNENQYLQLDYNMNASNWEAQSKDSTVFDANDNIIERHYLNWGGSSWENGYRNFYSYNSAGLETLQTSEDWSGTAWVFNNKTERSYDQNNNESRYAEYFWGGTVWENGYAVNYGYDSQNRLLHSTSFFGNLSVWDPADSTVNYYSSNNLPDSTVSFYRNGTIWDYSVKTSYAYTAFNEIDSSIEYYHNGTDWEPSYKSYNVYNGQALKILGMNYSWAGFWEPMDSLSLSYDANQQMIQSASYFWNGVQGWDNSVRTTYTYDVHGNMILTFYEFGNANLWEGSDKYHYYYEQEIPLSAGQPSAEIIATAFPNPTADVLNLQLESQEPADYLIRIINVNGQAVFQKQLKQFSGSENLLLSVRDLPQGIYYLQLSNEKGQKTIPIQKR
jgi:hypothetical protein